MIDPHIRLGDSKDCRFMFKQGTPLGFKRSGAKMGGVGSFPFTSTD